MPDIENLYIEKSEIRNSDNFAFVDGDYDQDNSGGNIWEWIDIVATEEIVEVFRDFINDDNSMLRLNGSKYHTDIIVDYKMRKDIQDILNLYSIIKIN